MVKALFLDTSGKTSFLAFSHDFQTISSVEAFSETDFIAAAGEFVKKLHEPPEVIGVSKGPGKFSALRQGYAYGVGLSQAWGVPIFGWSSIDVLVPQEKQSMYIVCIPINRREVVACVREGENVVNLTPPKVLSKEQVAALCQEHASCKIVCSCGDFFDSGLLEEQRVEVVAPDFNEALRLIKIRWERGEGGGFVELDYPKSFTF